MLKSHPLTGTWNLKYPLLALAGYLLVVYPVLQIGLGNPHNIASLSLPLYCFMSIALISIFKKLRWDQLGLHTTHWKQNLLLGGLAGALILIPIPLLDGFITASGLEESDLFSGAHQRVGGALSAIPNPLNALRNILLIPLAEQVFFTGFVFQALLKKCKPSLAVYLGAVIFVLVHFKFNLGTFGLGLICFWFFHMTGSLMAPILFHMACQTGGILLTFYYPRVVTFLGFLF